MKKIYFGLFLLGIFSLTSFTNANFLDSIGLNKKNNNVKLDFTLSNSQTVEEALKKGKETINGAGTNLINTSFITEEEAIRKRFYELQNEELKKKALEEGNKLYKKGKNYFEKTKNSYKEKVLNTLIGSESNKKKTNIKTTKKKNKFSLKNKLDSVLKVDEIKFDELCNKHTKDVAQFSTGYSYINDQEFNNIIGSFIKVEETYKDEPEKIGNMYAETYLNFYELWNKYALGKTDCEKFVGERYNQILDIIAINSTNYHNLVGKNLREKGELGKRNIYAYTILKDHQNVINSGGIDNIWTGEDTVLKIEKDKNEILTEFKNKEMKGNYLQNIINKYYKLKNMNLKMTSK